MSDVKCPYCGEEQEINHDDGHGYAEGDRHEQYCTDCDKELEFTTAIIYHYDVYCKDGDHKMEQCSIKEHSELYECENCDYYEVRR